jgi:hypothetical protein
MSKNEMSNRIVEIEYELFLSIRNGHRPSNDDCYKNKRTELDFLRCLYFGIESKFCKIKKGT